MGGMTSQLFWGGHPDEINEVSGLTKRDIYHVQSSWELLYKNAGENGMMLFLGIFRKSPETQALFDNIKGLSEEQIVASYPFRAHVHNLMSSINASVANLHDPQIVIALMHNLGALHKIRKPVKERHFYDFKEVVVDVLSNELKLTEDYIKSWVAFIDFINKHILERFNA